MAITVPKDGDVISAATFGAPVANWVNNLDAAWIAFTPTMTMGGGNPGAGRIAGRYKMLAAKTCTFWLTWNWGQGAFGGSGEYRWSLPVAPSANMGDYDVIGAAHLAFAASRKIATIHKIGNSFGIFGDWGQLSATAPQMVTIPDGYYMSGTYETV